MITVLWAIAGYQSKTGHLLDQILSPLVLLVPLVPILRSCTCDFRPPWTQVHG